MNLLKAAIVAAATLAAVPASATVYDFSANLYQGPNTGMLTGTVDLSFVSGSGSGSGAASNVTVTSLPAGIPLPEGPVATSWSQVFANAFTVTSGAVTGFQFDALTGPDAIELCFNNGGPVTGGGRACPSELNFIGTGGGSEFGYNFDGASGITFTPIGGGVPEPATWTLMVLGAGLAGAALRRRARAIAWA